jgi:hypothetical protein
MLKSHFVSFGSALLAGFSRDKSGETGANPCWLHRGIWKVHSQRLSCSCISLQVTSWHASEILAISCYELCKLFEDLHDSREAICILMNMWFDPASDLIKLVAQGWHSVSNNKEAVVITGTCILFMQVGKAWVLECEMVEVHSSLQDLWYVYNIGCCGD